MKRTGFIWLLCLGLAGCGIPIDSEPETLVLELDEPSPVNEPLVEDLAAVSMYLVRDERVVHVTRDLPSSAGLEDIVDSLLSGVSSPEERANLRTSIPAGTRLLGLAQEAPLLRIDLSRDFASVGGEEELLAVAQIVLTTTAADSIDLVMFLLEGVPTDVPVASGALSVEPVSAQDYQELIDP